MIYIIILTILIANWFSTLKRLTTIVTFPGDHVERCPTSWEIDQPLVKTRLVITLTTFVILTTDGGQFVLQFVIVANATLYVPASTGLTGSSRIIFAGKFEAKNTLQVVVNRIIVVPEVRVFSEVFSDGANLMIRPQEPQCGHGGRRGRVQLQVQRHGRC